MRISLAWLLEWVDPGLDPAALAARLTMSGIEVESIEPAAGDFQGVVVGEVLSVERHPGADKLTVCQVAGGGSALLQIVCGASNVRAGMKTPLALEGARLAGGDEIRRARLRGVESNGMLCSARELGLSDEHEGILELPDELVTGTPSARRARARRHDPVPQCDAEPRRRAVGAGRRARGRGDYRAQADAAGARAGGARHARTVPGPPRGGGRLPALRRPRHPGRESRRAHAAVDAGTVAPRGPAADPPGGGRHQLRDARARPAAARLRPAAPLRAHRGAHGARGRNADVARRPGASRSGRTRS